MKSFPTVQALAEASDEQVNAHWAGLGFYRRARFLHQGAKYVVERHGGIVPQTMTELQHIPGIGRYTAAAIASIVYQLPVAVVDGNVCRVLARLTGMANHIKAPILKDRVVWDIANQIILAAQEQPPTLLHHPPNAGDITQALMELGATYCAPSGTGVDPRDPLRPYYLSTQLGQDYYYSYYSHFDHGYRSHPSLLSTTNDLHKTTTTATRNKQQCTTNKSTATKGTKSCLVCDAHGVDTIEQYFRQTMDSWDPKDDNDIAAAKCGHAAFPLNPPKGRKRIEDLAVAVLCNVVDEERWWFLVQRPPTGLLAGQWEFPSVCVRTCMEEPSIDDCDRDRRDKEKKKKKTRGKHQDTNDTVNKPEPTVRKRRMALTKLLHELTQDPHHWIVTTNRIPVQPTPIEHIFSHVKHMMWIEAATNLTKSREEMETMRNSTTDSQPQVRWMREQEMNEVGITAGVKKVIKAVTDQMNGKVTTTSRKRKKLG